MKLKRMKKNQAVQTEGVHLKLRKVSFIGARASWPSPQWAGWAMLQVTSWVGLQGAS